MSLGLTSEVTMGLTAGKTVLRRWGWLLLLLNLLSFGAHAQFGPLLGSRQAPQAKTQEELDLYLGIYLSEDPKTTVAKVNDFVARHGNSELVGLAYQHQMRAYRELSDFDGVLRAGEKALVLIPRNVHTLLTLAITIPNGASNRPDAEQLLRQATQYAQSALEELKTMKVPQEIALESWELTRAEMEAEAHEALGHVAFKQGDMELALREFQAAVNNNPNPKARQLYRLGSAYVVTGQNEKAVEFLQRAVETGEGVVRELAQQQLARIRTRQEN